MVALRRDALEHAGNPRRVRKWLGGYVRLDDAGREHYIIERRIRGIRYHVSTHAHSERAALAQLQRFEADPINYDPSGGAPRRAPLFLDEDLVDDFCKWSEARGNTRHWVREQRVLLGYWAEDLHGRDLRKLALSDFADALDARTTTRAHRVQVLKAFFTWLRKERGLLGITEDATLNLRAPQGRPAQWEREKAVSLGDFWRVRKKLASTWRDALDVLAATGWHVLELERFARGGAVEKPPPFTKTEREAARQLRRRLPPRPPGVLLCPQTKSGAPLRTAVSREAAAAARRVLKRGGLSKEWFRRAVHEACVKTKVEKFSPGQMRHSVATWAINAGADPAAVAAFLGHRSPVTTRKFYATHAVPARVPTLI